MTSRYGGRLGQIIDRYPRVFCPICQTPQVQIVHHLHGDAGYKCRHCKQEFSLPFIQTDKEKAEELNLYATISGKIKQ